MTVHRMVADAPVGAAHLTAEGMGTAHHSEYGTPLNTLGLISVPLLCTQTSPFVDGGLLSTYLTIHTRAIQLNSMGLYSCASN